MPTWLSAVLTSGLTACAYKLGPTDNLGLIYPIAELTILAGRSVAACKRNGSIETPR